LTKVSLQNFFNLKLLQFVWLTDPHPQEAQFPSSLLIKFLLPWKCLDGLLQRRRQKNVKPRRSWTNTGTTLDGLSSAVKKSPSNEDSTMVTSNVFKNARSRRIVAPETATLPDDGPVLKTPLPFTWEPIQVQHEDVDCNSIQWIDH